MFSIALNLLLLALPLYMLQVYDRVLTSRSFETLGVLTLVAIACMAIAASLDVIRSRLLIASAAGMDALAGRVFSETLVRSASRNSGADATELRDAQVLRNFLSGPAILAVFDLPWTPAMLLLVWLFHPLLGVVGLVGMALIVALTVWEARSVGPATRESVRQARSAFSFAEQSTRNAESIAAMGMRTAVVGRWARLQRDVTEHLVHASERASAALAAAKFVRLGLQVVMLGMGAYLVLKQVATPGVMIAATIVFARAIAPLEHAVGAWRSFAETRGAYRRLAALLDGAPSSERFALPAPRGAFAAQDLGFAFQKDQWVLRGVSLNIEPGEVLGVFGPSGSGKSTLARLAVGVWKPGVGVVRLDGADLATWDPEALGRHIGYLPQAVELLNGTVAENIARMGDAAGAAEAVVEAAKRAHVHDLILSLPQGYETEIGEGGGRLSGGQRQRVALARALFGGPSLVVLDEPNANLDSHGEEALVAALRGMREAGSTVIIVTHRLQLLHHADKLLMLNRGRVERYGPRDAIIKDISRRPEPVRRIGRAQSGSDAESNG